MIEYRSTRQFARDSPNLALREGGTATKIALERCPACGLEFTAKYACYTDDRHPVAHLHTEHGPADFGLTPLGGESCGV